MPDPKPPLAELVQELRPAIKAEGSASAIAGAISRLIDAKLATIQPTRPDAETTQVTPPELPDVLPAGAKTKTGEDCGGFVRFTDRVYQHRSGTSYAFVASEIDWSTVTPPAPSPPCPTCGGSGWCGGSLATPCPDCSGRSPSPNPTAERQAEPGDGDWPDVDDVRRVYRRACDRVSERGRPGADPHRSGLVAVITYCCERTRSRTAQPAAGPWRVGHKQPRYVYEGDEYRGVMFDPADAARVVAAMNAYAGAGLTDEEIEALEIALRAAHPGWPHLETARSALSKLASRAGVEGGERK